jgi:hypothetical protein
MPSGLTGGTAPRGFQGGVTPKSDQRYILDFQLFVLIPSTPLDESRGAPKNVCVSGVACRARVHAPLQRLDSGADLYVEAKIHRKMLLGKKAGSEAPVGRKSFSRVSFQECPAGSLLRPLEGVFPYKLTSEAL